VGLTQLAPVAALPGIVQAVSQTLWWIWRAKFKFDTASDQSARVRDFALIQTWVRAALPSDALNSADLPSGRRIDWTER
jgi:hypothetical protein